VRKPVAWILLVLVLLGLGHSTYSMFMGRLTQGLFILPILMVAYVWTVGRRQPEDPQNEDESDSPPQDRQS
jgi:hypothetical protein